MVYFRTTLIYLHMLILPVLCFAQSTVKIHGSVIDAVTGLPLSRANIVVAGSAVGATTDSHGAFYIENMLAGIYSVSARYMGYETQLISDVKVSMDQPGFLSFKLKPTIINLPAIEISESRYEKLEPVSVNTITLDDIKGSHAEDVGDLLTRVNGIEVMDTGGTGSRKTISIRGSQSNQVLVLLNGVPLNDVRGGDVDLSLVPVNMIKEIKVYKGGQSPQFGSGAIGGVIDIITIKDVENEAQITSSYGSFKLFKLETFLSGRLDKLNYFVSYNQVQSDGDFNYSYQTPDDRIQNEKRKNSDHLSHNYYAKIDYKWEHHQVGAEAQRMDSDRGLPGKINYWTAHARTSMEQEIYGLNYSFNQAPWRIEAFVRSSHTKTKDSNLWPDDAGLRDRRYPRYHYENNVGIVTAQSHIHFAPMERWFLKVGYQFRSLDYDDKNLLNEKSVPIGEAKDVSHGIYVQQEWNYFLPSLSTHFIVTPVIRYDDIDMNNKVLERTEQQWSPGIGGLLSTGKKNRFYIKSNISRSFRVPTFADLFYQDFRMQGKPDLLPEKSFNREFGIGCQLDTWGKLNGEVTTFTNTIDDLIVWRLGSFETFSPYNTDAEINGTEYSFAYIMPDDLIELNVGYSHINALNKSSRLTVHDKFIPYRPEFSLKSNFILNYKQWFCKVFYQWVGKRYVTESNTIEMPSYHVWDLTVSRAQHIGSFDVLLKAAVFNLANKEYQIIEDMPLPPREWRIGFSLQM